MRRSFAPLWAYFFGYDVFISYARRDGQPIALPLREALARHYLVFVDESAIDIADRFPTRIEHALRRAKLLVVILTEGALASDWVLREVQTYRRLHKKPRICPIFAGPAIEELDGPWACLLDYHGVTLDLGREPPEDLAAPIRKRFRGVRKRAIAVYALAGLVLALSIAAFAVVHQGRLAESRELAASSLSARGTNLSRALELAVQAYATHPTHEAVGSLLAALQHRPALLGAISTPGAVSGLVYLGPGGGMVAATRSGALVAIGLDGGGIKPIGQHPGGVNDLAVDPSRGVLISTGHDTLARFWDLESGQPLGNVSYPGFVRGVDVVTDSGLGAAGDDSGSVQVWELDTRSIVAKIQLHEESVQAQTIFDVAFDPKEPSVLLASSWGKLFRWRFSPDSPSLTSQDGPQPTQFWRVSFDPARSLVAVGTEEGDIRQFEPQSLEGVGESFQVFRDGLISLAHSPDGRWLASGSSAGEVVLLSTEPLGQVRRSLNYHSSLAGALAFSTDSKILATGGREGVALWDVDDFQVLATTLDRGAHIWHSAAAHDRDVAAFIIDGRLRSWDVETQTLLATSDPIEPDGKILALAIHDGAPVLAVADDQKAVRISSRDHEVELWQSSPPIVEARFDDTGGVVLTKHEDGTLRLWDSVSGALRQGPIRTGSSPGSMAVGLDGNSLIVSGFPTTIYRFEEGKQTSWTREGPVDTVAFSPDGRSVALADRSYVRVIDHRSGKVRSSIEIGGDPPYVLAFSPDGAWLAGGGYGESVIIWDVRSGQMLGVPLRAHDHPWLRAVIRHISFTPDGRKMITAADDGRILLWTVEPKAWAELARQAIR